GIQVLADINPYWADRCLITQAQANRVAVTTEETAKANVVVNVAAVIEDRPAQTFFQRYWKAPLGIEDKELVATCRDESECRTRRRVILLSTENGRPLRSCAVQRKASQAVRSSGEEQLADRNMT